MYGTSKLSMGFTEENTQGSDSRYDRHSHNTLFFKLSLCRESCRMLGELRQRCCLWKPRSHWLSGKMQYLQYSSEWIFSCRRITLLLWGTWTLNMFSICITKCSNRTMGEMAWWVLSAQYIAVVLLSTQSEYTRKNCFHFCGIKVKFNKTNTNLRDKTNRLLQSAQIAT